MGTGDVDGVPTHVWDFEAVAMWVGEVGRKTAHSACEPVEAIGTAFLAVGKQQLCANADTKKWFGFKAFLYGLCQTAALECGHAIGHGALSGEDDFVGTGNGVGAGCELDMGRGIGQCAGGLDGFEYGVQVTHAVVDDGDVHGGARVKKEAGIVMATRRKDNLISGNGTIMQGVYRLQVA